MKMVNRKTGDLVDVPDDKAHSAFMTGQFGFPKGVEVPVIRPGMAAGTVAPTDLPDAAEGGSRVAEEAEFRKAQLEARYGGVGGAVEAGVIGAARGAGEMVGLPTDALALGIASMGSAQAVFAAPGEVVDPYKGRINVTAEDALRERLTAHKEIHPFASAGGELAGMVGAAVLGGGAIGKAGAMVERGAGLVARGALEGGAMGGVAALNEAALGNEELTASKVIASIGHGALIGGAATGGIHLASEAIAGVRDKIGRWVGTVRPKDIERVAEGHFGHAPEGLGEQLQKFYAKSSAAVSGKDADVIEKFTALTPEGAAARRVAVFDAPIIQETAEREVRKHVDDILRAGDLVAAEAKGSLKASYVRSAVTRGNEEEVKTFATQKLNALIDGAAEQLGQEMAPSMLKGVETVSKLAYRAQAAIEAGDNAVAFIELDNVKRGIQKLTSTGYRSVRAIADPVDQINARRTVEWLDGAAADLRRGLEDEAVWGKAAQNQREINAAWTKQIDASKRFHKSLTTEVGRDPNNPYLDIRGADPAKVSGYIKNLTNPHNDLTHKAVRDFVDSTEALSKAIKGSYELPADKLDEVERVAGAARGFKGTIDKAEKSLVLANQYRALTEGTNDSLAGLLGAVGFGVGGVAGGVVGAAMGSVAKPGKMVAQLAAIERLSSKIDNRITEGVRGFLSGNKAAARELPASSAMLAGPKGERVTFEKKVNEVLRLKNNPEELVARIEEFTSQFEAEAPNLARAITLAAIAGIDYLAAHAPAGFAPRPEALAWNITEAPLYSDAEMRAWARRASVVNDPTAVLEAMRRQMITPEEADALRNVHRPIYEQIQREIVVQRTDRPKSMNFGQQLQLELLFEVPLNRALERDFMRAVQQSFTVAEPKPAPQTASGGNGFSRAVRTVGEEARSSE